MNMVGKDTMDRQDDGILITPLDAPLGAEVRIADVNLSMGSMHRDRIRNALLEHLVIIFRGLQLNDEQQLSITEIFGAAGASVVNPAEGPRHQVVVISNKPGGALGNVELRWHSDQSFQERPVSASLLRAIEIPPVGGDTYFNNMYLALATLPAALRERISGLTIKNDISTNSAGEQIGDVVTDLRTSPGPSHPIIRTHAETGLNALYLGRRPFAYVNGLSVEDSEALLDELWAHATRPDFEYGHRWQEGDLVVWDNRAVMHRRDAFDETQSRVMHRTQCIGDIPFYDPAANSRGNHPRGIATSPTSGVLGRPSP